MKPAKKGITDAEFVTAWAKSNSLAEVAEKTGLAKQSVLTRGTRLRKAGVKLPRFARRKSVDVEGLNSLLTDLLRKPVGRPPKK